MGLGWLLGALCGWLGDLRPTFWDTFEVPGRPWEVSGRIGDALWEHFGGFSGRFRRLGDVFGLFWEHDGATLMVLGDTTERFGSCLATSGPHYENIEKHKGF